VFDGPIFEENIGAGLVDWQMPTINYVADVQITMEPIQPFILGIPEGYGPCFWGAFGGTVDDDCNPLPPYPSAIVVP
jgi:hypothetical protein